MATIKVVCNHSSKPVILAKTIPMRYERCIKTPGHVVFLQQSSY